MAVSATKRDGKRAATASGEASTRPLRKHVFVPSVPLVLGLQPTRTRARHQGPHSGHQRQHKKQQCLTCHQGTTTLVAQKIKGEVTRQTVPPFQFVFCQHILTKRTHVVVKEHIHDLVPSIVLRLERSENTHDVKYALSQYHEARHNVTAKGRRRGRRLAPTVGRRCVWITGLLKLHAVMPSCRALRRRGQCQQFNRCHQESMVVFKNEAVTAVHRCCGWTQILMCLTMIDVATGASWPCVEERPHSQHCRHDHKYTIGYEVLEVGRQAKDFANKRTLLLGSMKPRHIFATY